MSTCLSMGDDPAVEPGDTAVRAFIGRAGRPVENWDSREAVHEFARSFIGKRPDVLEGVPGGARVGTWLMPEDLATVDALILTGSGATRGNRIGFSGPSHLAIHGRAGDDHGGSALRSCVVQRLHRR